MEVEILQWMQRELLKRLGADEAMIIYRRDREHMPAHEFER